MPTLLPPTRGERIGRAVAYLFTAGIGVYVLMAPWLWHVETSMSVAPMVWAGFMITALPAAWATWQERHHIEFVLLPLFGSALLVALINTWIRAGEDPTLIGRACASSALLCLFAVRLHSLHRISKIDPPPWTTTER